MGVVVDAVLALLYPSCCAGCGGLVIRASSPFCKACRLRIVALCEPWCERCGYPLPSPLRLCVRCERRPPAFDRSRAWAAYRTNAATSPVARAIYDMKYGGNRSLAGALGDLLAREAPLPSRSYTMVVPVPLHPRQLRCRGFNQAVLLARPLARRLAAPLRVDVLHRQRDTPPQVGLSRGQRLTNVSGAFRATASLAGAAVLLVDDVCTTGATIEACARTLRAAGALTVDVCTLARTVQD